MERPYNHWFISSLILFHLQKRRTRMVILNVRELSCICAGFPTKRKKIKTKNKKNNPETKNAHLVRVFCIKNRKKYRIIS